MRPSGMEWPARRPPHWQVLSFATSPVIFFSLPPTHPPSLAPSSLSCFHCSPLFTSFSSRALSFSSPVNNVVGLASNGARPTQHVVTCAPHECPAARSTQHAVTCAPLECDGARPTQHVAPFSAIRNASFFFLSSAPVYATRSAFSAIVVYRPPIS